MSNHENLTEDQEQIASRREYLISTFGDDVLTGLDPIDEPAHGKGTSAAKHYGQVKAHEREAGQERAELAEHFKAKREAEANDPLRGVPTAEQHAARYALRGQEQDDDDERRREGRRPQN
jgi:hypothetical protein